MKWGAFVQSIIDFLLVAFVIFMLVRALNHFKKPEVVTTKDVPNVSLQYPSRLHVAQTAHHNFENDLDDIWMPLRREHVTF